MQDFSTKNAKRRNRRAVQAQLDRQRKAGGISWGQQQSAARAMKEVHKASLGL